MTARTVKLVVIGESGVGKTSLRGQYISGRFSTGYRATIGADFITKTLPHPHKPDETVTLQIWDTAGQERFSSLSAAFFRGADAVLLMFDANEPRTLAALDRWWNEFREKAPVPDEEIEQYPCVLVGNKIDLAARRAASENDSGERIHVVSEDDARAFADQIVPPSSRSSSPEEIIPIPASPRTPSPVPTRLNTNGKVNGHARHLSLSPPSSISTSSSPASSPPPLANTPSIAILHPKASKSLSRSRSRTGGHFAGVNGTIGTIGTMNTMTTTLSIYHTPSSSFFDAYTSPSAYASARSSPRGSASFQTAPLGASSRSASTSPPHSHTNSRQSSRGPRRVSSLTLSTTSSAPTITPGFLAHQRAESGLVVSPPPGPGSYPFAQPEADDITDDGRNMPPLPPSPERGPAVFFTSAKTGAGVAEVFTHVAARVVRKWDYEEALEARTMHVREDSAYTIRLGSGAEERGRRRGRGRWSVGGGDGFGSGLAKGCCGS